MKWPKTPFLVVKDNIYVTVTKVTLAPIVYRLIIPFQIRQSLDMMMSKIREIGAKYKHLLCSFQHFSYMLSMLITLPYW